MKHFFSLFFASSVLMGTAFGAASVSKTIPAQLKGSWKVVASEKAGTEKEEFTRADLDVPMGDIVQFNSQVSLNGRKACGADLLFHLDTGAYSRDFDQSELLKAVMHSSGMS